MIWRGMWWLPVVTLLAGSGCGAPDGDGGDDDVDALTAGLKAQGGYAGKFNRPGQGHADVCVKLKSGTAELRYPDFTPTGYSIDSSQLQFTNKGECPNGRIRLDAREILQTPQGRLFFHRGGYGYENGSNVKYGHVWIADLASHVDDTPGNGNGGPCAASKKAGTEGHYRIRPKELPSDMHFCKSSGACDSPATTNGYSSYGDPAQQGSKADPSIHYTYLVWSWINVQGGGVVRTLLRNDDVFHRCDVPSIKLATVTEKGQVNGWVKAIYGKTSQGGSWIYGWTVHSHKLGSDPTVFHVEPL